MMQDVKITCPGPSGIGTKIEIDGKPISLTTKIQVDIGLEDAPKVIIERHLSGLELSGKFEIDDIITFADRPGKKFRLVEVEE